MLQNITELTPLLDRLAPLLEKNGGFGLMQDNAEFRGRLKMLTPAFDYTFSKATLADHKTFFYNLLYIAQQDLSLALMCIPSTEGDNQYGPSCIK